MAVAELIAGAIKAGTAIYNYYHDKKLAEQKQEAENAAYDKVQAFYNTPDGFKFTKIYNAYQLISDSYNKIQSLFVSIINLSPAELVHNNYVNEIVNTLNSFNQLITDYPTDGNITYPGDPLTEKYLPKLSYIDLSDIKTIKNYYVELARALFNKLNEEKYVYFPNDKSINVNSNVIDDVSDQGIVTLKNIANPDYINNYLSDLEKIQSNESAIYNYYADLFTAMLSDLKLVGDPNIQTNRDAYQTILNQVYNLRYNIQGASNSVVNDNLKNNWNAALTLFKNYTGINYYKGITYITYQVQMNKMIQMMYDMRTAFEKYWNDTLPTLKSNEEINYFQKNMMRFSNLMNEISSDQSQPHMIERILGLAGVYYDVTGQRYHTDIEISELAQITNSALIRSDEINTPVIVTDSKNKYLPFLILIGALFI